MHMAARARYSGLQVGRIVKALYLQDQSTLKMDMLEYKPCHRCNKMFSNISALGQWECMYHPKKPIFKNEKLIYPCCNRAERAVTYSRRNGIFASREHVPNQVAGCTPCDCGNEHDPVSIASITDYLTCLNVNGLKGLNREEQMIYRTQVQYEESTRILDQGT